MLNFSYLTRYQHLYLKYAFRTVHSIFVFMSSYDAWYYSEWFPFLLSSGRRRHTANVFNEKYCVNVSIFDVAVVFGLVTNLDLKMQHILTLYPYSVMLLFLSYLYIEYFSYCACPLRCSCTGSSTKTIQIALEHVTYTLKAIQSPSNLTLLFDLLNCGKWYTNTGLLKLCRLL